MNIPPRFPVTRAEIQRVVSVFYNRVRSDPTLGPVFAAHVKEWPSHEDKITRFWANAILHERSYDGNPMQKHMQAGNVKPEHFETWLAAFDDVLQTELSPEVAKPWSALAHRIGRGLQFGLEADKGGIPKL